jgi:hypothetical protein
MVRMTPIAAALWRPRLPKRLSPHLVKQYSQSTGEKKSPFSRYFESWPVCIGKWTTLALPWISHNLSFAQSFSEIDPHEVKWVPVNGVPRLYMNRALSAGLRHRLPPSVVLEAHMSISYVVNRKSTIRVRFYRCMSSCRIYGQLPSCHRKLYSFRRGSLGKPKYLSEELETDPMRAHYELGVSMAPLPGSSLWVCPCPATP